MTVLTGLDQIQNKKSFQEKIKGNVAYLCHSASVDKNLNFGVNVLQKIFGTRLKKLLGPQHGMVTTVQDNMVETDHFTHPYFKLPVYSLYSETRAPTPAMLEGIDTLIIDLQDVGCRVYTYIYTMTLAMEVCGKLGVKVVILDRPNPIDGVTVEGNILDLNYKSFVGLHALPMRHALTMGEVAVMAQKFWNISCELEIIPMDAWKRDMPFEETGLSWVLPSPNLPTVDSAYTFPATVLFEGTNISEGRGTTRSLEIVGHPAIEPYSLLEKIKTAMEELNLQGFILRPLFFEPTFQKHAKTTCGGYQIHVTDRKLFKPWAVGQVLMYVFYHELGDKFQWKQPPYEYETKKLPIDIINGTDEIRHWIEKKQSLKNLWQFEKNEKFLSQKEICHIY